jgi:ubiquinone/menaquinone biosynthesis C-methylase UbiE
MCRTKNIGTEIALVCLQAEVGKHRNALQTLRKAQSHSTRFPHNIILCGIGSSDMDISKQARRKKGRKSGNDIGKTMAAKSQILAAKAAQANQHLQQGEHAEAIAILEPLLKAHKPDGQVEPLYIEMLLIYAECQRRNRSFNSAYQNYCTALRMSPEIESRIPTSIIYDCLVNLSEYTVDDQLTMHLFDFLNDPDTNSQWVVAITQHILATRYHLTDSPGEAQSASIHDIAADQLLLTAISQQTLANRLLDLFLMDIRKSLLVLTLNQGLDPALTPLITAMGLRGINNEFISFISADEQDVIDGLVSTLNTQLQLGTSIADVSHVLLLVAMYQSLWDLSGRKQLQNTRLLAWPKDLQAIAKFSLFDRAEENKLSRQMRSICPVSDAVSLAVKQQYEANPYPRWQQLDGLQHKQTYTTHNQHLQPWVKLNGDLTMLVAGCGTGKQALVAAAFVSDVTVTAIDLSKRSLAYAQLKARQLDIHTIEFIHGDILDLRLLDRQFDLIECSGVLHHMQNPEAGLTELIQRLAPDGVINLGLYSRIARRDITVLQNSYKHITPSTKNIRDLRYLLLNDADISWTDQTTDFYALSPFRDLVMHAQEHQYTLPEIAGLLARHNLEFLGFKLASPQIAAHFRQAFPADPQMLNLNNWHTFEQKNPDTFKTMYNFHCRRRPD